jgi:hypothetical protein
VAGTVPARPDQAASGDQGGPVPENLKTLFAPTGRPGDPAADASGAAGRPELPAMTLLGQGNDAATGQAFYQHLVGTEGVAAGRVRSMDPEQLQQLAAQGPPRTADSVLDIATGTRPAPPGTLAEWERGQKIQQWFADSRERPADFEAFAGALPATERAKLDQTFEAYTPGNLNNHGSLIYWGNKATDALRDLDAQGEQQNPHNYIPGSWPDRISRSARKLAIELPAGTATSLEHLLIQDEATGSNPLTAVVPLTGESMEHAEQRLHPFSQDLKAVGQTYADEVGPGLTHGDWSKLGNSFYNDPVDATARYLPIGPPSLKLASRLSRADRALVDAARAKLRPEPGALPLAEVPGAAVQPPQTSSELTTAATGSGPPGKSPPASGSPEARAPATGQPAAAAEPAAAPQGEPAAAGESTAAVAADGTRPPQGGAPTEADSTQPATGVGATVPELGPPGATGSSGDDAIAALQRGDKDALAEALKPRPLDAPRTADAAQLGVSERGPPARASSNPVEAGAAGPDADSAGGVEPNLAPLLEEYLNQPGPNIAGGPTDPAHAELGARLKQALAPHRGMSLDELGLSDAERQRAQAQIAQGRERLQGSGTDPTAGLRPLAGRSGTVEPDGGLVSLFRNVTAAEFDSIAATGKFSTGNGSLEDKWFASAGDHADKWGEILNDSQGLTVTTDIPRALADQLRYWPKLDGIGPAYAVGRDQIDLFNQMMNGIRLWR